MGLLLEQLVVVLVLALVNGDEHNHIVSEMRKSSLSILLTRNTVTIFRVVSTCLNTRSHCGFFGRKSIRKRRQQHIHVHSCDSTGCRDYFRVIRLVSNVNNFISV